MLTRALAILLLLALIACAVLGVVAHSRGQTIDTQKATLASRDRAIADMGQANGNQQTTINELQHRLDTAAGKQQAVEKAANEAQRLATDNANARDAALVEAQRLRGEIYARDTDAAAWAAGRLPGALSDQLRQQWNEARAGGARHQGD